MPGLNMHLAIINHEPLPTLVLTPPCSMSAFLHTSEHAESERCDSQLKLLCSTCLTQQEARLPHTSVAQPIVSCHVPCVGQQTKIQCTVFILYCGIRYAFSALSLNIISSCMLLLHWSRSSLSCLTVVRSLLPADATSSNHVSWPMGQLEAKTLITA